MLNCKMTLLFVMIAVLFSLGSCKHSEDPTECLAEPFCILGTSYENCTHVNRTCVNCTVCSEAEYMTEDCTHISDRECAAIPAGTRKIPGKIGFENINECWENIVNDGNLCGDTRKQRRINRESGNYSICVDYFGKFGCFDLQGEQWATLVDAQVKSTQDAELIIGVPGVGVQWFHISNESVLFQLTTTMTDSATGRSLIDEAAQSARWRWALSVDFSINAIVNVANRSLTIRRPFRENLVVDSSSTFSCSLVLTLLIFVTHFLKN